MISFFRRFQKPLFVAIIVVFLIGTFVGLGGYLFTSRDMDGVVASVGKTKIPYALFVTRVNQYSDAMREKGVDVTDQQLLEIKQGMLRDMIVDELLQQKAAEMGLEVTDAELANEIKNTPGFQRGGQFSQDLYYAALRQVFRQSPAQYETERRKYIRAQKFKQLVYQSSKVAPDEVKELYAKNNKGSLKDFEKQKEQFTARVQQQRAIDLINYYLKQLSQQVEIRTYLQERESGA